MVELVVKEQFPLFQLPLAKTWQRCLARKKGAFLYLSESLILNYVIADGWDFRQHLIVLSGMFLENVVLSKRKTGPCDFES